MPVVSADSLQLAIVPEVTFGVTPATPGFMLFRTTGEDLTFAPNTSESGELGGAGRYKRPSNVTGVSVTGSINFELTKHDALEWAIQGVLAAAWGECPLTGAAGGAIDSAARITVGNTLQSATVEKRFVNPAYVEGTVVALTAAATGGADVDLTFVGAAGTGTGWSVVTLNYTGGVSERFQVAISVGDDASAAATALAAAIDESVYWSATALAGVVTAVPVSGLVTEAVATAGSDQYFYQRYTGVVPNTLNLTTSPNNAVTGSVGFVGGVPVLDVFPVTGATYASAGTGAVFTAPEVTSIDVATHLGVGSNCFTELTIDINSNDRGIQCIGTSGDKEVVLGTLDATLSGSVYFSDDGILRALLNNETVGDATVTFTNSDGDVYRFDWYGVKPLSGSVTAGGTGQDLIVPLSFQATPTVVCTDGAANWESGLILSTVDTAPTLPEESGSGS